MSKKPNKDFQYDAHGLLDKVMEMAGLKNDAALARYLEVAPPVISKIRHNRMLVGDSLILKFHEIAGMTLPEIRKFIGGSA